MNNYNKIENKFINDFLENGTMATKDELLNVLTDMKQLLENCKDKSVEEVVSSLAQDLNTKVCEIVSQYPIPGYNVEINSGNINVNVYGGTLDENDYPMVKDAIFDVASITKLITQIISYNLIYEGYYGLNSKVADLCPEFKNAGELDIKTIMEFTFAYSINGKIENAQSVDEARQILFSLGIGADENGKLLNNQYRYIDFGMMALKEIMEHVTGRTFQRLFNEYITQRLDNANVFIKVPKEKLNLITGTPNAMYGKNNDMKAIKLGGVSGNAGILSDSNGLHQIVKNLYTNDNFFPQDKLSDVYVASELAKQANFCWGTMGNACTIGCSFVDKISPMNMSGFQGSTRTQVNIGKYNDILTSSTILLNPSSMGLSKAKELEEKLNKKILTEYEFERKHYAQMASQLVIPVAETSKPLTKLVAELQLKLAFLNTYIKCYEPNFQDEIQIDINNKKF